MWLSQGMPREINKVSSQYNVCLMDDSTGSQLQRLGDEYHPTMDKMVGIRTEVQHYSLIKFQDNDAVYTEIHRCVR